VSPLGVLAADHTIGHGNRRSHVLPAKHQALPIVGDAFYEHLDIGTERAAKLCIVLYDEKPLDAVHQGVLQHSQVRLLTSESTAAGLPLAGAWDSAAVDRVEWLRLRERPAAGRNPRQESPHPVGSPSQGNHDNAVKEVFHLMTFFHIANDP
jgi:hypothetical protein